jgi:hypothetical protein
LPCGQSSSLRKGRPGVFLWSWAAGKRLRKKRRLLCFSCSCLLRGIRALGSSFVVKRRRLYRLPASMRSAGFFQMSGSRFIRPGPVVGSVVASASSSVRQFTSQARLSSCQGSRRKAAPLFFCHACSWRPAQQAARGCLECTQRIFFAGRSGIQAGKQRRQDRPIAKKKPKKQRGASEHCYRCKRRSMSKKDQTAKRLRSLVIF